MFCCALLGLASESRSQPLTPGAEVDPQESRIPDDYISELTLDITAKPDRLELIANFEVVVHRGAGWHDVDLKLGQAVFSSRTYEGPGEEAPDMTTSTPEAGQRWKFRGLGKHRLKLQGWFPGPGDGPEGQFQLSLPQLPRNFAAGLNVHFPRPDITVRPHESLGRLEVRRAPTGTEISASVVENNLLFAWQSPREGAAIGNVHTEIAVQPARGRVTLLVDQYLSLQQPGQHQVDVRLPEDFRLIRVIGNALQDYAPLADRPGWLRLRLATTTNETANVQWILERTVPIEAAQIVVSGFQVDGAAQQDGLIRVGSVENYRVLPQLDRSEKLLQVDVARVREVAARPAILAYEYQQQPFQLALELAPVTPFFVCRPRYELDFRQNRIQLTAEFPLQFERGSITELRCDWAGFSEEGWQVTGVDAISEELGLVSLDESTQAGVLRFFWRDAVSSDALLRLTCTRPLPQRATQDVAFSFPVPRASQFTTAELTVRQDDAMEIRMSREQGTGWAPLDLASDRQAASSRSLEIPSSSRYWLDDPYERVLAEVVLHSLQVSASSTVQILSASNFEIVVDQVIEMNVQYGRIPELQLLLPAALGVRDWEVTESFELRLGSAPGTLLPIDRMGRVRFPIPLKGKQELKFSYRYPLASTLRIVECDLPLIRLEFPFQQVACQIADPSVAEVRVKQSRWETVRTSLRRGLWICPQPDASLSSVPLLVGGSLSNPSEPFAIRQITARTWLNATGTAESVAEIVLQSRPTRIVCLFPLQVQVHLQDIWVDGAPVKGELLNETTTGPQALTIPIPRDGRGAPRIVVRYRQPVHPLDWRSTHAVNLPAFDPTTWVERTDWELRMPDNRLLLQAPRLTPRFHWTHRLSYALLAGEMKTPNAGTENSFAPAGWPEEAGLTYAFTGDGPSAEVTFQTIDRSLVILLGAASTLLLGYICGQFPLTRSLSFAAGLGLTLSVAALWFEEALLLFLPPAMLGLVLALIALWLESPRSRGASGRRKRRAWSRVGGLPGHETLARAASTGSRRSGNLAPTGEKG